MIKVPDISKRLAALGQHSLNFLFPSHCTKCNEPVDMQGSLCSTCWQEITFISAPCCVQCGYPFDYELSPEMICASCIAAPPPFTKGRSVLKYDEFSRDMVLSFKHADRTDQAPVFAKWMLRSAPDLFEENVLIAPVPLHNHRLIKRRYNQAALLVNALASLTLKKSAVDLLIRTRATPSQGSKSFKGRFRNVQGAFSISSRWKEKIMGEHILLIDDVYTTGATVSACSECLLKYGAAEVSVLTLCRVVRPAHLSI